MLRHFCSNTLLCLLCSDPHSLQHFWLHCCSLHTVFLDLFSCFPNATSFFFVLEGEGTQVQSSTLPNYWQKQPCSNLNEGSHGIAWWTLWVIGCTRHVGCRLKERGEPDHIAHVCSGYLGFGLNCCTSMFDRQEGGCWSTAWAEFLGLCPAWACLSWHKPEQFLWLQAWPAHGTDPTTLNFVAWSRPHPRCFHPLIWNLEPQNAVFQFWLAIAEARIPVLHYQDRAWRAL